MPSRSTVLRRIAQLDLLRPRQKGRVTRPGRPAAATEGHAAVQTGQRPIAFRERTAADSAE